MAEQEIWYREFIVHYYDPKAEEDRTYHGADEADVLEAFDRLCAQGNQNLAVVERMYRKITGTSGWTGLYAVNDDDP